MITTIPADLIILLSLGMTFALGTFRNFNPGGSILVNRYFMAGLLFNTLFCMPIAIYCYVVFPDWCWMYWLDASDAPTWLVWSAFACYYVSFTIGFAAAVQAERKRKGLGARVLSITALVFLLFIIVYVRRALFVGSIEEFQDGSILFILARPLLSLIVFGGMALALTALVAILSWFGSELDYRPTAQEIVATQSAKRSVSITRIKDNDVKGAVEQSLSHWGGLEHLAGLLREDRPVFIKPNLAGGGKDRPGTQTSPEMIEAVVEIIRRLKPGARIIIGESGSIVWWDLRALLGGSRYERLFDELGCEFINLSRCERSIHDFGGRIGRDLIPELLTRDPVIIDLPLAKTHAFYRMSGAIKNMFGVLPAPWKLLRYHMKGFADWKGRVFLDILRNFPPHLVIIDANVAGEGFCPVAGAPKQAGFVITSDHALAADRVLSEIMGFRPGQVPYLDAAAKQGLIPEYSLFGDGIKEVAPAMWKKTRLILPALVVNFFAIVIEHLKRGRHG